MKIRTKIVGHLVALGIPVMIAASSMAVSADENTPKRDKMVNSQHCKAEILSICPEEKQKERSAQRQCLLDNMAKLDLICQSIIDREMRGISLSDRMREDPGAAGQNEFLRQVEK